MLITFLLKVLKSGRTRVNWQIYGVKSKPIFGIYLFLDVLLMLCAQSQPRTSSLLSLPNTHTSEIPQSAARNHVNLVGEFARASERASDVDLTASLPSAPLGT